MKIITPKHIIIKLLKVSDKGKSPWHVENKGHIQNGEMRMAGEEWPVGLGPSAWMLVCPSFVLLGPAHRPAPVRDRRGHCLLFFFFFSLLTLDWQDLFHWCSRWGRIAPSPLTLCTCLSRLSLKRFVFGKGRGGKTCPGWVYETHWQQAQ